MSTTPGPQKSIEEPQEDKGLITGTPRELARQAAGEDVPQVWNMEMLRDGMVACGVLGCIIVMLIFGTTHTGLIQGTTLGACLADNGALPAFKPMFQISLNFRIDQYATTHRGDADRIHNQMEEVYCGDRVISSVFAYGPETSVTPPPVVVYPAYETKIVAGTGPYYSLIMVDPDYPRPASLNFGVQSPEAEYLHWMVVNITGTDLSTGKTIIPYEPPPSLPQESKGVHRFTVLLFAHGAPLNEKVAYRWPISRVNFNTSAFRDAYSLRAPVAGTVFRSGKGAA